MDICRKEQPFVIRVARSESTVSMDGNPASPSQIEVSTTEDNVIPMETERDPTGTFGADTVNKGASTSAEDTVVIPGASKGALNNKTHKVRQIILETLILKVV